MTTEINKLINLLESTFDRIYLLTKLDNTYQRNILLKKLDLIGISKCKNFEIYYDIPIIYDDEVFNKFKTPGIEFTHKHKYAKITYLHYIINGISKELNYNRILILEDDIDIPLDIEYIYELFNNMDYTQKFILLNKHSCDIFKYEDYMNLSIIAKINAKFPIAGYIVNREGMSEFINYYKETTGNDDIMNTITYLPSTYVYKMFIIKNSETAHIQ